MRVYRVVLLVILTLSMFVTGCARSAQVSEEYSMADEAAGFPGAPREAPMPMSTTSAQFEKSALESDSGGFGASAAAVANVADRMIIRTVSMSVVVDDTDVMLGAIQQLVKVNGGYIAGSNRWLSGEQAYASVTLRVPADKLEAVLGVLRDASISVENESSTGDDVTEEYVDVSARLRNLEATEEELLQLLTEVRKNRGSAEDILAIHNRITELRSQIESLKGRQQYLERSAALATININIRPKAQPGSIVQPARWNPSVTVANALRAFVELLQILLDVLIWLLILSPVVLIPALVIWLIVRSVKRRRARKSQNVGGTGTPGVAS
ncbi:MAG: DUF4349 domain-containing protein [Anaerolineae bacterium]